MSDLTASSTTRAAATSSDFVGLRASVEARFQAAIAAPGPVHLFVTDTSALYPLFLGALPEALRQRSTCAACRSFVERYGGLVRVAADGTTVPILWDEKGTPEPYAAAIAALAAAVSRAPILGVFLSQDPVWGRPATGEWLHFAVTPTAACLCKPSALQTPGQRAAERLQDHATLLRGLEEFPRELVANALALLTNNSLSRSEKCIGVATWLADVHKQRRAAKNERRRDNLTWLAVASAPPGFCHVRSTMIGTLLEDLAAKLPFPEIRARFAAKMDPTKYLRPVAAPSAGNIAQAEKIIATMRTAGSLERRFARLADIRPLWVPAAASAAPAASGPQGVFSHLKSPAPAATQIEAPAVVMTWEKFARTVLPTAGRIEYLVPASAQSYLGMVTAKHPEAPPIVQWDFEDERNPVTYYVYAKGSPPAQWNLRPGAFHPVTAVTLAPAGVEHPAQLHPSGPARHLHPRGRARPDIRPRRRLLPGVPQERISWHPRHARGLRQGRGDRGQGRGRGLRHLPDEGRDLEPHLPRHRHGRHAHHLYARSLGLTARSRLTRPAGASWLWRASA